MPHEATGPSAASHPPPRPSPRPQYGAHRRRCARVGRRSLMTGSPPGRGIKKKSLRPGNAWLVQGGARVADELAAGQGRAERILFWPKRPRIERHGKRRLGRRVIVVCRVLPWLFGGALVVTVAPAQGQSNLDAGKSPAQIFSDTCNACHRSPREVRPTSPGFLREHYTTGPREAAAMAAYLASVGSDPRAVQQRRPPALGAGQAASPGADQGNGRRTPEQGQPSPGAATASAIRPRRPSESVEAGNLPIAAAPGGAAAETGPPQAAVAAPPRQRGIEAF